MNVAEMEEARRNARARRADCKSLLVSLSKASPTAMISQYARLETFLDFEAANNLPLYDKHRRALRFYANKTAQTVAQWQIDNEQQHPYLTDAVAAMLDEDRPFYRHLTYELRSRLIVASAVSTLF